MDINPNLVIMHSWSVFSLSIKMTITWQTPPFPLCSNSVVFVRCAYKLISSLFLFCVRVANPIRRIVRAEQADCSLDLISTLKCSLRERNWHAGWVITCFWRKKKKKVAAHTWRLTPFSISSAEISFYSLQTNIFVSKKTVFIFLFKTNGKAEKDLPSPLRNLLTPLGSGSGYESK